MKYPKDILFALTLVISILIVYFAIDVFLLAFASILLALLWQSIGSWTKKWIHLPYIPSLLIAFFVITGAFTLIFWLYSPLIAKQFQMLANQLPEAASSLRETLDPYISERFFSADTLKKEFSVSGQSILSQAMALFSTTIGSIVGFVVFLIVGVYLTVMPERYLNGFLYLIPKKKKDKIVKVLKRIGDSLRYWLLGKVLSMIAIGILTYIGLLIIGVSLAVILGLLAGILTFIPYVGPILAAIPAVLIAFADYPLKAVYVIALYIGVHIAEGYLITPVIEQKTVSIPPALTIMVQILSLALFGPLGLALASPLIVVVISLAISSREMVNQT